MRLNEFEKLQITVGIVTLSAQVIRHSAERVERHKKAIKECNKKKNCRCCLFFIIARGQFS